MFEAKNLRMEKEKRKYFEWELLQKKEQIEAAIKLKTQHAKLEFKLMQAQERLRKYETEEDVNLSQNLNKDKLMLCSREELVNKLLSLKRELKESRETQ